MASTTYISILQATVTTPTSTWSYDIYWRYPFETSTYYQYNQHVQLHRLLTTTTPSTTTTTPATTTTTPATTTTTTCTPATFTTIS